MRKYDDYTRDDFLDDAFFIGHVKYPTTESNRQWDDWLARKPANEGAYREAFFFLKNLMSLERLQPTPSEVDRIFNKIEKQNAFNTRKRWRRRIQHWSIGSVAASVLLAIAFYWYAHAMIRMQTGNGQMLSLTLPDSTVVQLNANSSLRYHRAWNLLNKREVWVNGEVLLRVKHLNKSPDHIRAGEHFTAYTKQLAVEVLGTTFNIRERRGETEVSLLQGKLAVKDLQGKHRTKFLKSGELIRYRAGAFTEKEKLTQQASTPAAWTGKELDTHDVTVATIMEMYQDLYGKTLVVRDPHLLQKRIDGKLPLTSERSIIYALANILDAEITFTTDTVYLKPKK